MIRVFLVDDHEIVRRGVAQLINAQPGMEVVGESATMRGTLDRVAAKAPDIVVLDVRLPDGSGIDLCRRILSAHPDTGCLILTAYDDDVASTAAVMAGASGYVLKNIGGRHLIDRILQVAKGESLVTKDLAVRVHSSITSQHQDTQSPELNLTVRESQVLELITEGLTNRQIGARLNIAEKTVKNYVSGLLAKLGMKRRTQVAAYGATTKANYSQN
ncbi:response regulator transcription factor [Nesterenkonia haasae]|uniref:response regulator transcription factor n=1 Tax=Nesterenkonia haasae TaxID=2587813 RepID=UPI00139125BF|nr:response regulator transcription factor [Nesterenkonia haasae]NDK32114.1 response regulator transcription factor [Nesterenkonia haasae]